MDVQKALVQAGSAAGTGVVAQFAEKRSLFGAGLSGGLVASVAAVALAMFMAPTARGNTLLAMNGVVDGSATWLALKYVAPQLGVGYRRSVSMPMMSVAPMAAFSGGRGGIEI